MNPDCIISKDYGHPDITCICGACSKMVLFQVHWLLILCVGHSTLTSQHIRSNSSCSFQLGRLLTLCYCLDEIMYGILIGSHYIHGRFLPESFYENGFTSKHEFDPAVDPSGKENSLDTRGYFAEVCLTVYLTIAKIRDPIHKHRCTQFCMVSDKAIRWIFWYCARAPGAHRCDLQHLQERDFTLCIITHAHLGCCYGQLSGRRSC